MKKRIMSLVLTVVLLLSMAMPYLGALAADYTVDTTSPLYQKRVMFCGDSICASSSSTDTEGTSKYGGLAWAGRIMAWNDMTGVNAGKSGASISKVRSHRILDQLIAEAEAVTKGTYDYIIFNGGVNDAWDVAPVGEMTTGFDGPFDELTFAGGFEATIKYAKENFPEAKLGYIVNFSLPNTSGGKLSDMSEYFTIAKKICDKWSVPYLDLYFDDDFNQNQLKTHTNENIPDWVHPNSAGYEILAPKINEWMKAMKIAEPTLKAAVLSDTHVRPGDNAKWFEYVLKWYKAQGVEAVIIPGDLINGYKDGGLDHATAKNEIKTFFEVWKTVFPEQRGEEGYVEPIFIYGNHDKTLTDAEKQGVASYWKEYLGETYSPVYSKQVGGYWFVCVDEGELEANKAEVKKQLETAIAASNGAPVFYLQHCAIYQTTGGSDGTEYGANETKLGYELIKNYENVIAFTGHTHRSITDEASIWQGADWEEGKFTTVTCSTLDYVSMDEGVVNGNATHTKQGMLMTAEGNQINLERYSFYTDEMKNLVAGTDTAQDFGSCVTSAGEDWTFTVGGEKPYTYDKRYEASITPEFAEGANATVVMNDTSATLTFPKASMSDGTLFKSYVVEARDARSGLIKATGLVNTEYHIDADTSRYADTYSVTVNGLTEDAEYDFYVYGSNFFGKRSAEPLIVSGITTGTRTGSTGEKGDVNADFYSDIRDLIALKKNGTTAANKDVDANGTVDVTADMAAMRRILLGYTTVVEDNSNDLLSNSTYQTANYDASCQGYGLETKKVNNVGDFADSKLGFEFWAKAAGSKSIPSFMIWFDEAQDWTGSNVLNFDYYSQDTSTTGTRSYEISLITGEHKVMSTIQSGKFYNSGWNTISLARALFKNADWTNVKGVKVLLVFDNAEGRYNGTDNSAFYVDNMRTSYQIVPDNDLLSHYKNSITANGGNVSIVTGDVVENTASGLSCEAHKLVSSGDTATLDIPLTGNPARINELSIAAKLSNGTVTMQAYDATGALVGTAKTLNTSAGAWTVNTVAGDDFDYDGTIKGYRFTITGANTVLLLDDFSMTYKSCASDEDYFSIGTVSGSGFIANANGWEIQPYNTNNSNSALHISKEVMGTFGYPQIWVELPEAIDKNDIVGITVDGMVGEVSNKWMSMTLYDENGNAITNQVGKNMGSPLTWSQVKFMSSEFTFQNNAGNKVKKVRLIITNDHNADSLYDSWLDNLRIITKDKSDLLESSTIVTGSTASEFGADYYYSSDGIQYPMMDKNYLTEGRNVVKISRPANGSTNTSVARFYVKIPEGTSVNELATISFEGWFSQYAKVNVGMVLVNDDRQDVTNLLSIGSPGSYTTWNTYQWSLSQFTVKEGCSLEDATMIRVTIYSFRDSNKDKAIEIYLDNLKLQTYKDAEDILDMGEITWKNNSYQSNVNGYPDIDPDYILDDKQVVKIVREAIPTGEAGLKVGFPTFEVKLPEDVKLNATQSISIDGWIDYRMYHWVSVGFLDAEGNKISDRLGTNFTDDNGAVYKKWDTETLALSNFEMYEGKTLEDVAYIQIIVNVQKNPIYDGVMYLNNLKLVEGPTYYACDQVTTAGTLSQISGTVYDRDDVVAKYVNHKDHRYPKVYINDSSFKDELTEEDSIRFYVYIEKGTNFNGTSTSIALFTNNGTRITNGVTVPFEQWTMITMNKEQIQTYLSADDGLKFQTTVLEGTGGGMTFNMYMTDVEILKFANKDFTQYLSTSSSNMTKETTTMKNPYYSGASTAFTNGAHSGGAFIDIDDSLLLSEIESGDSLEFYVYMNNFGSYNGVAEYYLCDKTTTNAIGDSRRRITPTGNAECEWVKITLDAEAVQKYIEKTDGHRIRLNRSDAGSGAFRCTIILSGFTVVKNVELQSTTMTHEEPLNADASVVHGVYDSVSAKHVNGYWDAWAKITVDDSGFKETITKYDSIEFWAYVTGGQSTVEKISLGIVSENNNTLIKNSVTLTRDQWTQIRLTPSEVAAYINGADGMKFIIAAEGANVSSQGGTDYTLYIDEFRVLPNGNYDEVSALEPYSCTNTNLVGTFTADYDMVRGTDNRCSAAFVNNKDSRWTFITIDDSIFKDEVAKDTVIEFWAYLKPSTATGCDYTSITLAVGTNSEQNSILVDQTLTFNDWTKISLSGDAIAKYIEKQNGLRLRVTVNDGSNMSYTLYLEDLRVIQPSDEVHGSLNLVDVYTASSSDKILQNEDCSYLGTEFVLNTFKNEYESGQLILAANTDIAGFMVSATDFTNGSQTLSAENFEIYTEYYHEVERIYDRQSTQKPGMYPDALLPITTAAEYGMNCIAAGENQGIWIAVKVPSTQKAGTYQGGFVITLGEQTRYVPAQIIVADYILLNTVSLQSCIPIQRVYISQGELTTSQEMYTKYVDLLNKFRLSGQYVIPTPTDADGYARGHKEAEAALAYANKPLCSAYGIRVVEKSHETYGKVLNQTLFESYLKAYIDVSIENSVDLFAKAYVYMGNICDEPSPGIGDERAQYCAQQFNSAVANAVTYLEGKSGNATFLSQLKQSLQSLQNVVTTDKRATLSDVNTYCPRVDAFDSSANMNDKTLADNYWWYTCTQPKIPYPTYHIDDEAASARIMGWLAKESGVKGYLTWEMIYTLDYNNNSNVLRGTELYDNVHRWSDAYGDGFLVYPGRIFGLDSPVESLRLYALGDGMEDYEALTDLVNTYENLAEQYDVSISPDGILEFLYDMLADNTRVYGDGSDIATARQILTRLLLLAKNEGTAISDFEIENGVAKYCLVTADGIEEQTYTLEATTTTFATSNVTTTDNIAVSAGTTEGTTIKVTMSGLTEYDVNCSVPSGTVTSDVDKMYLTVYNNSDTPVTLTVYSNKTERLDTFTLKPGKNVLSFAHMQQLNWFVRKGMTSVTFKVEMVDVTETSLEFGSITVMKK